MNSVLYEKRLPENKIRMVTEEKNFILAFTVELDVDHEGTERVIKSLLPDFKVYSRDKLFQALEEAVTYDS